jgi:membrane-associated HD superfamily phosphohydrolase
VLDQVMRRAIPEDAVDIVLEGVPGLVSLTLNEQQSGLVSELVSAFVVPNSFYSEELTLAARKAARDAVKPVVQVYKTGETVVPAGEIVTPADMEAFQQLGLIRPGQRWEDMIGAVSLILLSGALVPLYFFRRKRAVIINDARNLMVIAVVFMVFLVGARLFTDRTLAPYGRRLLLTTLFGLKACICLLSTG